MNKRTRRTKKPFQSLNPVYTVDDFWNCPLSQLYRIAVNDMRAFRNAGGKLDMNVWLEPATGSSPCAACMAGAILANSCQLEKFKLYAGHWEREHQFARAINALREGLLAVACSHLRRQAPALRICEHVYNLLYSELAANYYRTSAEFAFRPYLRVAAYLESQGL